MARKSKVFSHPNKPDIDRALAARESYRTIADRFGLSKACLIRYAQAHFPAELAVARNIERINNADCILRRLELELDRLQRIAMAAENSLGDPKRPGQYVIDDQPRVQIAKLLIDTIRSATPQLKLILDVAVEARKAEKEKDVPWEELQRVIYEALRDHPEARKAVANAIKATIEATG